ncbi:MAG TPA: hypothetical protein VJZ24_00570, partial [Thermodesulfovibrionales bacterium]|nr:hypothetical protein [Thermodesulfovibrionales bacterium]
IRTGINYDWWDDDQDTKASQVYIPLRIKTSFQQFSMSVITGYTSTHITSGEEKKSLNSLLDTKVNTSYELSGNLPVDLLVGFDVNLPTGKTGLQTDDSKLIMDPDLISINNFGEGYDINPTLTVTKEMGNWVGGIGFGYAWRGTYDYIVKDFNPGDIINSSAEIRYSFSSHMTSRFFGNIVMHGADKVDGMDVYREGNLLLLGIGLHFAETKWDGNFTLRSIFRGKSKLQDGAEGIITEDNKSQGDEWIGDIYLRYLLNDSITLKSSLQGRWISENDYASDSNLFVGQREKFSVKLGASKIFMPNLDGEVMVKGFVMHDGERLFPEERSERDYKGGSLEVVLTTRF